MDIKGGSSKEGTKILLYKRKDGRDNANQQWTLVPASGQHVQPQQPHPQYGNTQQHHSSGNVPYYPPPAGQQPYGGMYNQQGPPAGGMGGYGLPDDMNPQYQHHYNRD